MKRLALVLFVVCGVLAHAEAPSQGVVNNRDTSVTNIPVAYGSAGSEVITGNTGKSNLAVINNSAADLAYSLSTVTANCSGGVDNAIVPATGSSVFKDIQLNTVICVRSLSGSPVASGTVRTMVW